MQSARKPGELKSAGRNSLLGGSAKISSDCSSAVTLLGNSSGLLNRKRKKFIHSCPLGGSIVNGFVTKRPLQSLSRCWRSPNRDCARVRPRLKSSTSPWDTMIDAAGGTGAVAKGLEQLLSTISGWRSRGIPSPYWAGIVRLAVAGGRDDITLDMLANLRAAHKLELMPSPTGATAIAPCQGELPNV